MLDRKTAPEIAEIQNIDFRAPHTGTICNVPFYHMADVPNETCRFDLYFNAGKIHGNKSVPAITNGLLLSGTSTKNTNEINEAINGLGGYFESGISVENAVVSIYCLNENLAEVVSIVVDAIQNVVFPQNEIDEYLADRKQQFMIGLKKVSFNAQRSFQKILFASNENYAQVTELSDYDELTRETLVSFHKDHYLNGLQKVVLVGSIENKDLEVIHNALSNLKRSERDASCELTNQTKVYHVNMDDAMQSAIRVGRILFNKTHPDYLDFIFLNTILGDYFGSRLMANIREDKGYTYGIGSHVVEFQQTGYFVIGTEVKKEVREDAINEIRKEIERLQNELVEPFEIELVKNYMMGQLLKSADGPYAMTDLFLSAILNGKDLSFYNEAIASIQNITAERIQELAKKYLNWEDLSVVSAG